MNHNKLLASFGPCPDAWNWYDGQDSYRAWRGCHRGDWLLFVASHLGIDRKTIGPAACDCVELTFGFVADSKARITSARTLEIVRRWCRGEASWEDVRRAAREANEVVNVTCTGIFSALANATPAAYAAYAAAAYADDNDADTEPLRQCAVIVRRHIPWRVMRDRIVVLQKDTR